MPGYDEKSGKYYELLPPREDPAYTGADRYDI
jgi:hypothetical protein